MLLEQLPIINAFTGANGSNEKFCEKKSRFPTRGVTIYNRRGPVK